MYDHMHAILVLFGLLKWALWAIELKCVIVMWVVIRRLVPYIHMKFRCYHVLLFFSFMSVFSTCVILYVLVFYVRICV